MPAPDPQKLLEYFEELIAKHQPEGQYAVFEREFLKTSAFRHFKTTSPAIESRMKTLYDEGKLVKISISHHGFVHLDELGFGPFTLHFQYSGPRRYSSEDWGLITSECPKDKQNVWRNGYRNLYTTAPRRDEMVAHFKELKRQAEEKERQKKAEEKEQLGAMLEQAMPGARQLLRDLKAAIPGMDVRARMFGTGEESNPWLKLDADGIDDVTQLLAILRRGLPDAPRETSTTED